MPFFWWFEVNEMIEYATNTNREVYSVDLYGEEMWT